MSDMLVKLIHELKSNHQAKKNVYQKHNRKKGDIPNM